MIKFSKKFAFSPMCLTYAMKKQKMIRASVFRGFDFKLHIHIYQVLLTQTISDTVNSPSKNSY